MTRFTVQAPDEGDTWAGYWSIEGYNSDDELVLELDVAPEVFVTLDLVALFSLVQRSSRRRGLGLPPIDQHT